MMETGKVYLVGAGPGDPELLTYKAVNILKKCHAVLYDYLVSPEILQYANPKAERIFVGKKKSRHSISQQQIHAFLYQYAKQGKIVVRLKGGDPAIFGRAGEEYQFLFQNNIPCQIIPGITAASAAAAELGIALSDRRFASNIRFMTGHKRVDGDYSDFRDLDFEKETCVIYMGVTVIQQIMDEMNTIAGREALPVAVLENASRPNQRLVIGTIESIASLARKHQLRPPAIIIAGAVVSLVKQRLLDNAFELLWNHNCAYVQEEAERLIMEPTAS